MGEYLTTPSATVHWKSYDGDHTEASFGPTLLLVHGLGGSVANWDFVGPRLAAMARVVAIDLPGFGLSPPAKDWELETQAAVITEVIEHLGGPVVLVANSLGGLLCEMVAAEHPDLVVAMVLIAPATPPRLPDVEIHWPTAFRMLLSSLPLVGPAISRRLLSSMSSEQLVTESLARIAYDPSRIPMDVVRELIETAEQRRTFPWAALAVPETGQAIRRLFTKPSRFVEMIRDIKSPTLVVQGVADPIVSPTSVKWMCSLRPDWQLVEMESTGHVPQLDAPMRLLGIIDPWLESVVGSARPLESAGS